MQYLRCATYGETSGEIERTAYMVFIDLEKAYDRVLVKKSGDV